MSWSDFLELEPAEALAIKRGVLEHIKQEEWAAWERVTVLARASGLKGLRNPVRL